MGKGTHKVSDITGGLKETGLEEESSQAAAIVSRKSRMRRYITGSVAVVVIVGLCITAVIFSDELDRIQEYGYLGVFIISIFAGGTVIVPVPGLLVVFTMGSILHPAIVGIAAGLGEAIGVISIYLAGSTGQGMLEKVSNRLVVRFTGWLHRYSVLAVFFMSAILNPLYYPFALLAGALRFGLPRFFIPCWAGKTLKNTAVAYLGFFGFGSLLGWLGVLE
jgi:membrane protein YqaA with SNARE-associated domain